MFISFTELAFHFFFSLTSLFVLRKVALNIGLVDKPNARKQHEGAVPLVGGISICLSLLFFLTNNTTIIPHVELYTACIVTLVTIGALDDKYDISYKFRFLVQAGLSIGMMYLAGIKLYTLGYLLDPVEVTLGPAGYVVTIFAVVGAINAFNMVDGIDGLLGVLSTVTFAGLGLLVMLDWQLNIAYLCLVIIVIMLPYILLNLGFLGQKRKVFMGDAGSMLIGFTVIWLLLLSSQNEGPSPLRPVTALWLIAVPLMDMVAIMIRRIRRGDSPFKPDREHLHHIFQRLGLNSKQTLVAIALIAIAYAGFGIYGELTEIPEYIMLYSFIACFVLYCVVLSYIWVISAKVRKWMGLEKRV
ncbi:UDP-N-acetylglucosamine--undecaprenyl-phosphate N-acetylglucosaminephosphotransferase [Vibrio mediterranei]|uniref:UDP-N-acetylglucosamine--undecaprenyl-phosphate N-acetylglucosaminephosphotransferase n=1 Tax=Vibrio mediterranei TaxID=689 RepID=UPI002283B8C3|nr:UDP-N-acetylglucosamine--undecaprenyl-phosphate N-acetylglucosaminephosphotransferase [Vibrio mediterranei]MCY9853657.1 UDP-N-acetylglucosamine--undecaprenyl-phosphate N-acetylglucosaminephosphotransferase [Vibrio mediterranei]